MDRHSRSYCLLHFNKQSIDFIFSIKEKSQVRRCIVVKGDGNIINSSSMQLLECIYVQTNACLCFLVICAVRELEVDTCTHVGVHLPSEMCRFLCIKVKCMESSGDIMKWAVWKFVLHHLSFHTCFSFRLSCFCYFFLFCSIICCSLLLSF